jgi:hypothetical protein
VSNILGDLNYFRNSISSNQTELTTFKKETSDKFSSLHTQFESGLNELKSLQLDILKMVNEKLVQLEQVKSVPSDVFTKERMKNYHLEFAYEKSLKSIENAAIYIKSQVLGRLGYQNIQILTRHIYKMSGCNEEHLDEILKKVCEIFPRKCRTN